LADYDDDKLLNRTVGYYPRLRRVRDRVLEDVGAAPPLEAAAAIAGMSPSAFWASFKKRAGMTYTTWVELVQVEEAKRRFEAENRSVSEVAHELGMDLRTLERKFCRVERCLPSEYKRQVAPSPPPPMPPGTTDK
jgi:AraC-like DNA-binding protein